MKNLLFDVKVPVIGLLPMFLLLFLLSSCGIFNNPVVLLWTNKPELLAYVEHYNSIQDQYKVEVNYIENPGLEILNGKEKPDLVVGKYLNSPQLIERFYPVDDFFKNNELDEKAFYRGALKLGFDGKNQRILPFSFNLPAVVFKNDLSEQIKSGLTISLEEMKNLAFKYNRVKSNKVIRLGYSPLWNQDFAYLAARLMGADISGDNEGKVVFSKDKLKKTNEYLASWFSDKNYDFEEHRKFTDKYLVVPKYKLILDGRIRFMLSDSSGILNIPEEKRENLDFRWLSYEDRIPVEEDIIFMGILSDAKNKKGAKDLMKWLLLAENQEKLIKMNLSKRIKSFGICNGFSVIKNVNELIIPRYYGVFLGHIPPENFLMFPGSVPIDWAEKKKTNFDTLFPMGKMLKGTGN